MDNFQERETEPQGHKGSEKKKRSFLYRMFQKSQKSAEKENEEDEVEETAEQEEQSPVSNQPPPLVISIPDSLALYQRKWLDLSLNAPVRFADFETDDSMPELEAKVFFAQLNLDADQVLRASTLEDGAPAPVDAAIQIKVSSDQLSAWCLVLPPLNGGKEIDEESILAAAKKSNVVFGLREELPKQIAKDQAYMKLFLLAQGVPPVNGKNGWVEEVIPNTVGTPSVESDGVSVDYKNLNWLVQVKEGDIICKIIPPTEQTPGTSVYGNPINGKNGAKAVVPTGTNTCVSEDGAALIAKVDGQIFYDHNKYRVNQMIVIDGDVDLSTGNLKISGNLLIRGNVLEGFVVQATGDININGMVEGATIIAGGNIFVKMGMNGNSHGSMDAGKDIRCRYLENATARANGSIFMESIVNSTVFSDEKVSVMSGRGIIIGGTVCAMTSIEAKVIGNKLEHTTVLVLDRTAHFIKEKERINEEYQQVQTDTAEIEGKINSLSQKTDAESAASVKSMRFKLSVALLKKSNLQKSLEQIEEKEKLLAAGRIRTKTLFPITQIIIGSQTRVISDICYNCSLALENGEIRIGPM